MNVHEILVWSGIFQGGNLLGGFWSTPSGLCLTVIIFVCSCINIWHKGIEDNLFDRIWYSCMAVMMLCAFLAGVNDSNPHHIVQTLLYLLTVRMMASVWIKHRQFKKTGKCQKTNCH